VRVAHKTYDPVPESKYVRVFKICRAVPETENKPFGGHIAPCFRVRDKIFCGTTQVGRPSIQFKGRPGAQEALVSSDPERFFVPKYTGPKGWIGAYVDVEQDWDELAELIEESYRMVAPKTLVKVLDAR
jgi:predicted DNA-binding protein (MmcQ/YjbR family)